MSAHAQSGCNLRRDDFHPDGDERCADGASASEHAR